MRTITIKRKKSFVAKVMKMYVYLKSDNGNIPISGVKYKQIGIIKNGEMLEFEIAENVENILVCWYKSEDFNPALYEIKPGTDNVTLYAKAKLSPFKGNPVLLSDKENFK